MTDFDEYMLKSCEDLILGAHEKMIQIIDSDMSLVEAIEASNEIESEFVAEIEKIASKFND